MFARGGKIATAAREAHRPARLRKRAEGGSDFERDRLIARCRAGHTRTGAPLIQRWLVITPIGEGGMIVTRRDDLAVHLRQLRSHGMTTST